MCQSQRTHAWWHTGQQRSCNSPISSLVFRKFQRGVRATCVNKGAVYGGVSRLRGNRTPLAWWLAWHVAGRGIQRRGRREREEEPTRYASHAPLAENIKLRLSPFCTYPFVRPGCECIYPPNTCPLSPRLAMNCERDTTNKLAMSMIWSRIAQPSS